MRREGGRGGEEGGVGGNYVHVNTCPFKLGNLVINFSKLELLVRID